jgi:hypothetical protein
MLFPPGRKPSSRSMGGRSRCGSVRVTSCPWIRFQYSCSLHTRGGTATKSARRPYSGSSPYARESTAQEEKCESPLVACLVSTGLFDFISHLAKGKERDEKEALAANDSHSSPHPHLPIHHLPSPNRTSSCHKHKQLPTIQHPPIPILPRTR